jgi:ferric-chelate reductase
MSNVPGLQPFIVVPSPGTKNDVPQIPVVVASPLAYSAMPFVWHVDILLLVAFGIFVITTLPRAFARYTHRSERLGLFLRMNKSVTGPVSTTAAPMSLPMPEMMERAHDDEVDRRSMVSAGTTMMEEHSMDHAIPPPTEDTHTLGTHALLMPQSNTNSTAIGRLPRHVPNWLSYTHPAISYALNYPVASGFPVKYLALLLAYFGVLIYNGTFRTSPFTDPRRPSDIAVAQLPLLIAFAMKNNILAVLSGMGYEKVCEVL